MVQGFFMVNLPFGKLASYRPIKSDNYAFLNEKYISHQNRPA
jgi:hypothetical protein